MSRGKRCDMGPLGEWVVCCAILRKSSVWWGVVEYGRKGANALARNRPRGYPQGHPPKPSPVSNAMLDLAPAIVFTPFAVLGTRLVLGS